MVLAVTVLDGRAIPSLLWRERAISADRDQENMKMKREERNVNFGT